MRILFVINSFNAGGAEVHAIRLASRLAPKHEVLVASLAPTDKRRAVPLGELPFKTCASTTLLGALKFLRATTNDYKPELVVSVNLKPLVAVQFAGRACKHVSIIHSSPNIMLRQGIRVGAATVGWLLAGSLMMARVSKFVFVSSKQRSSWRFALPFALRPSRVIRNGVEIPELAHMPLRVSEGNPLRVAMVAAFRKEKNHALLVDALELLIQGGVPFEVVLAGDGPLRANIEARIKMLGVAENVSFAGSVADCAEIYQWADVTVLPSTAETLPLVIVESMAWGTPVVASDVGGNSELITTGEDGYLFSSGDKVAFANTLTKLRSPELRKTLGHNARRRACSDFSFDRMVTCYESVFSEE